MVSVSHPDYNTLGASINKITMATFGKRETIGLRAQGILNDFRKDFEQGKDKEQLIAEINRRSATRWKRSCSSRPFSTAPISPPSILT
ncbi:ABC transporter [Methylocaldum marinum]|uniref:ABC transporter n=1 Tax=Methylocaldum marinum TaxID=1432792 RepID=A0A250KPU6_9GAMM|nr:hypothetical protein [Methylocaldum marinum]BBA33700.1 ABC transporter [Methylocaldum marinum]